MCTQNIHAMLDNFSRIKSTLAYTLKLSSVTHKIHANKQKKYAKINTLKFAI